MRKGEQKQQASLSLLSQPSGKACETAGQQKA